MARHGGKAMSVPSPSGSLTLQPGRYAVQVIPDPFGGVISADDGSGHLSVSKLQLTGSRSGISQILFQS